MGTKTFLFLVSLLVLLSTAAAASFDIIKILSEFPEYSTFSKYLTDTKLADEINNREAITVLAVEDSAIAPLSSLPADKLKKVLSVHVLLDYYDPYMLDKIANKTAILTTLLQESGLAAGKTGYVNYTETSKDVMKFGSAEPGAPLTAELIKVVAAKPYNIIVHQVSAVIVPPSIQGSAPGVATPTPKESTTPSGSSFSVGGVPETGAVEHAEGPAAGAPEKAKSAASKVVASTMVGLAMGVVAMAAF